MTVRELIKELMELNQDAIVILQKDAEGNGYSPADGCEEGGYESEDGSSWAGQVRPKVLTPELLEDGYTADDVAHDDAQDCVVIWPIN